MSDSDLHALMVGPMWPGLRELNLASNTFSDNAIKKLCRHIIPAELAAIQFTRSCLSDLSGIRLKLHFGETLVWSGEQAATGLAR